MENEVSTGKKERRKPEGGTQCEILSERVAERQISVEKGENKNIIGEKKGGENGRNWEEIYEMPTRKAGGLRKLCGGWR